MNRLEKSIHQLHQLSLYALFTMPVLPNLWSSIIIACFVILSLTRAVIFKKGSFNFGYFFLSAAIYAVYILSLSYSTNIHYALKKLSTGLPILLLPFAFALFDTALIAYCKRYLKDFLKTYVAAVILLITASIYTLYDAYGMDQLVHADPSFLHKTPVLHHMDSLYLSMHVSIALVVMSYLFYISKKIWKAIAAALVITVLFMMLMYLSFKASIVAFLIGIGVLAILLNKIKLWALFGGGIAIIMALIVFLPGINQKLTSLLIIKDQRHTNLESMVIRDRINECSFEMMPQAGFFGYGIGDGKTQLNTCFKNKNSELDKYSYNTHNQYISLILNVGFIGLMVFILTLGMHLIISLDKKNHLAISISVVFLIWMLAENILERQSGVMFYALFTAFLFRLNFTGSRSTPMVLSHEKVIETFDK